MFAPAAIDLEGIKPIKVQPSEPRSLELCDQERDIWIKWTELNKLGQHVGFVKEWKRIPNVLHAETIIRDAMQRELIPPSRDIEVANFDGGAFHALFKLTLPDWDTKNVILRIPLPCDPWYKMESEVANMVFAAYHGVPVPRCLYFDSSAKNPYALEWMIIELVEEAATLDAQQFSETYQGRLRLFNPILPQGYDLLNEIKENLQKLERTRFSEIGSLYCNWEANSFYVGPIVDGEFHGKYTYLLSLGRRGPFKTVEEYLGNILEVRRRAKFNRAKYLKNKKACFGEEEVAKNTFIYGEDVLHQFTAVASAYDQTKVASEDDGPINGSWTYLQHDDLHASNILIKNGKIEAILDWEKCNILPPFLRKNHGVPNVNNAFIRSYFPPAIFSEDAMAVVPPEHRDSLPTRDIVVKLLPAPQHVDPLSTVLRLLATHVRKSDLLGNQNEEWVKTLDELSEWFLLHTPK